MFNPTYISQLRQGQLSEEGYKHIISCISSYIHRFNWPKSLVATLNNGYSKFWTKEEVEELSHQFFEWILIKGKLTNLHKVPQSYVAYYFSKVLVSFVADKINEMQQKQGISYEKVSALVKDILQERYFKQLVKGQPYWYGNSFNPEELKTLQEVDDIAKFLSKIPFNSTAKHHKSDVERAVGDIFSVIDTPLQTDKIIQLVFNILDQSPFSYQDQSDETLLVRKSENDKSHQKAIKSLLLSLSANDARMFSEYLFKLNGEASLAEVADKFQTTKQTAHYRIDQFRKKIFQAYMPENDEDGIDFLKKLSDALDNHLK